MPCSRQPPFVHDLDGQESSHIVPIIGPEHGRIGGFRTKAAVSPVCCIWQLSPGRADSLGWSAMVAGLILSM